ncbi:MAG: hypothetical protein O7C59_10565, partial [Rickettsia endosymbiont of Ixodes persulcatus]|nr:hypothetical protein [Rickettsia endosymbiont of Ixodes persulcatus]
ERLFSILKMEVSISNSPRKKKLSGCDECSFFFFLIFLVVIGQSLTYDGLIWWFFLKIVFQNYVKKQKGMHDIFDQCV